MPTNMRKVKPRKERLKQPVLKPPRADEELMALAEMLNEHKLEHDAEGWFKVPWNDGWNAFTLAFDLGVAVKAPKTPVSTAERWMKAGLDDLELFQLSDTYGYAGELMGDPMTSRMHKGALRCLQVWLANSGGDGSVYNDILKNHFIDTMLASSIAYLVMHHRCQDAIGVGPSLMGDKNDKLRRAFSIAWDRGLFLAAYALKPAVISTPSFDDLEIWRTR